MATFDSFIKQWSTTPASNGTTPNIVPYGWPEGMPPSAVNNTARQQMTDHRYQWEDAQWFCWGDTVSKASTNSIKIASDVTSRYIANRRVKILDNTTLYATIRSSSYSAPDTTITLDIDDNNTLATTTPQIALSIITPNNPAIPKSFVQNKNLIIGGNFDTNPWQRNTSFTAPATASYTADRFVVGYSGAMVFNILKTADAPTVADCGMLVSNCYHLDVTTADGSIAAGDTTQIETRIEGYDAAQILQRSFTLSFWVKATKTGTYCCYFKNSGNDRSYVAEYTVNSADTWEYKTITVTASPAAGTWDYTNGVGLRVGWTVAAGTTYQTTAGSWQTGNYLATANQVNGVDSTSNNFKLAQVQLEAGSTATAFEIKSADEVLAACQRYYIKTFSASVAPANNGGNTGGQLSMNAQVANCNNTASFGITWMYPVKMRATPTITLYNQRAAGTAGQWDNGASSLANAATTFINDQNCLIYDTGATCSVARWYIHAVASAEL